MKAHSLPARSIEEITGHHEVESFMTTIHEMAQSLLETVNHIGTAISLGEKGDLEAADAFRRKNSVK